MIVSHISHIETTSALQTVKDSLEVAAHKTLNDMFGLPTLTHLKFDLCYPLNITYGYSCNIYLSNKKFHATLTIAVNPTDLLNLSGDHDESMQVDTLGELGNTMSGSLMEEMPFIKEYGYMEQAPPLLIQGGFCMRKTWGLQGVIWANDIKLCIGFTAWPKK
jgi:hypothetical protein